MEKLIYRPFDKIHEVIECENAFYELIIMDTRGGTLRRQYGRTPNEKHRFYTDFMNWKFFHKGYHVTAQTVDRFPLSFNQATEDEMRNFW